MGFTLLHRFGRSHVALLLRRLVLVYGVLILCRIAFGCYNADAIGRIPMAEWGMLCVGAWKFDTVSVLYANALLLLGSLLPLHLRERRGWQRMLYLYFVIVNAVVVVLPNIADTIYFRYTQKRITAEELFFADNDNSLSLLCKFAGENIPLVLWGICLVFLLACLGGRRSQPQPLFRRAVGYYGGSLLLLSVAVLLSIAGMRGGVNRMTRPLSLSNAAFYASDNARANLILSNPFCILRTWGQGATTTYGRYFTPDELATVYTPYHRPDTVTKAPLAGRNVVLFVMESMSAEHSAYLHPELYAQEEVKGYTPFLDSLMQEGYCFTRMYANGTRSIQALPAVLGSIPSFKNAFALLPQALSPSRQLPQILRDRGYTTSFFCGSAAGSMGFGAYARLAGIEHLYSMEDYERHHGKDEFDGYWGIWDEPFLQYMGEELTTMPEPFFATLFTLSSHHPFVVPDRYRDKLPTGRTRNHKCVAYTDGAFRRFFARYHREEWFRRTIFVFVADHVSSEKFADATHAFPEDHHIIGLLYTPDGTLQGQAAYPVSQIDLMPTLLGLLGNSDPYFAFGRDIFAEPEPEAGAYALCYDNGFEAVARDYTLFFDEEHTVGCFAASDYLREHPLPTEPRQQLLERHIKAFVQQYGAHLDRKNFTVE